VKPLTPARLLLRLAPFLLFFLAATAVCPLVGAVPMDLSRALVGTVPAAENLDRTLLLVTRLPRVLLAAMVGAGLALAGATFQALLRNPLADPYTLGVAGGGALGAVIAIHLGLGVTVLGFSTVPLFAFVGATATIGLVYLLARTRSGALPTEVLLLAGVILAFFYSAMILLVHYLADFTESAMMLRWLMGGLDVLELSAVARAAPLWAAGTLVLLSIARDLNQVSFGAYRAATVGVNVRRLQRVGLLGASLVTATAVALAGPIGFVGLIVPHAVRLLVGPDHRVLMPASLLAGGGFLIVCDTVARTVLAPIEVPVGVFTAFLGGPFFVGLLLVEKRKAPR
jgi:iron complex transport system permease protein